VPLLQIAPSKTDTERLLVISPELADVLSAIMSRIRDPGGKVPLVVSYDACERVYNPPMPLLFQWRCRLEDRAMSQNALRDYLDHALAEIGAKDASNRLMRYTFHDFRRIFVTDAKGRGVASDATFRVWREDGLAGPAALPGVRRACGPAAGHAVDQGFLAPGCAG
jgi:hypothetical protein